MLLSIFEKHKICSNSTKSLPAVNPILSAKKWGFCDGTALLLFDFTLLSTMLYASI